MGKIIWIAFLVCLSIVGISISSYLEYMNGMGTCPVGFSGCEAVLFSPYSKIFGVPLSLLGLIWFTGLLFLTILSLYRKRTLKILISYSLTSIPSVIVLVWIEVILLRSICIYCTIAHLVGLASILPSYKLWKTFQKTRISSSHNKESNHLKLLDICRANFKILSYPSKFGNLTSR